MSSTKVGDPSHVSELSESQIAEIRKVFELFDQDGDTTITINELGTVMRALGQYPTESELQAIIAEIDADGNGIIEFPELVDLMSRRQWGVLGSHDELRQSFKQAFEHGGNGLMKTADFRKAMTSMGEKLTDEELDEMVNMFEEDGDGLVPFEEFVQTMME